MEGERQVKALARVFVAFTLLLPLIVLISKVETWTLPAFLEVYLTFKNTFFQASLSSLFTLTIGVAGAFGLLGLNKSRPFIEALILIPSILPSLFVILAGLKLLSPFPFGVTGVVFAHVTMYTGLAAVIISRLLESRIGTFAELALVEGASKALFIRKVALPMIWRDLILLFIYFFAMCAASFSVPLVLGGTKATTLEILIYYKALVEFRLDQAIVISLIQFSFLFMLSSLFRVEVFSNILKSNTRLMGLRYLILPALGLSMLVVVANLMSLRLGWDEIAKLENFESVLVNTTLGTWIVIFLVWSCVVFFLYGIALGFPHQKFESFLQSFLAPSTVLIGLGMYLLYWGPAKEHTTFNYYIKIGLGFTVLILASLYRLKWHMSLHALKSQLEVAKLLGASDFLIFTKIIFRQLLPDAFFLAGLGAFWAAGDFALSQIVSGETITLALLASGLMSSYRLEGATVIMWLALLLGALVFLLSWSLSYVSRQKLIS